MPLYLFILFPGMLVRLLLRPLHRLLRVRHQRGVRPGGAPANLPLSRGLQGAQQPVRRLRGGRPRPDGTRVSHRQ